jgi:hypothetical protein
MSFADHVHAVLEAQGATAAEKALIHGEIHSSVRLGEGLGANAVWRLEMGPHDEGAYFKPVNGVNQTVAHMLGHTRESVLLSEVAAYRLAHALGPPFAELVPPCVLRTVPGIDPHAPGSLLDERFGERGNDVFFRAPGLALTAAVFDALIANQDRSIANFLFDADRGDLALIDHGFAFPRDGDLRNTSLLLDWRRDVGVMDLADEEISALQRLAGDDELFGLRRYLDADRCEPVAARAAEMLNNGRLV